MKKLKSFNEDMILRGAWRRAFARFPVIREKMEEGKRYVPKFNQDGQRSKKDAVEFHCEVGDHWVKASLNGKRNIAIDHIVPVIDITNILGRVDDWNEYKRRLVCSKENLQRICKDHHNLKTQEERRARQTLKDNLLLDVLEEKLKVFSHMAEAKIIRKEISKFISKTKTQVIRERASALKLKLDDIIERQD